MDALETRANLGFIYYEYESNHETEAARDSIQETQFNIGAMHDEGKRIKKDPQKAAKYLNIKIFKGRRSSEK